MSDSEIFQMLDDLLTNEEKVHIDFCSEVTIGAIRKVIEAAQSDSN